VAYLEDLLVDARPDIALDDWRDDASASRVTTHTETASRVTTHTETATTAITVPTDVISKFVHSLLFYNFVKLQSLINGAATPGKCRTTATPVQGS